MQAMPRKLASHQKNANIKLSNIIGKSAQQMCISKNMHASKNIALGLCEVFASWDSNANVLKGTKHNYWVKVSHRLHLAICKC